MRLLLLQGLRHHRQKPLQTLLTLLGIAAGVALLCAMRLSQATAARAFDRAVEAVAGSATHTVTNGPEGMPVRAYAELRRRLGGRGVAPSMQAIARVPARDQETVLRVLGVDPFGDVELRPWTGPRSGGVPVGRLVTEPGARRPAGLPWTAVLDGPAPSSIENGELVDVAELDLPDAEAKRAAQQGGVLIRFLPGVTTLRYDSWNATPGR